MPIRDKRDPGGKIIPDPEDIAAIEAEHGALPDNATAAMAAQRYQLAQARKIIRLWEQGKLPVEQMREMDNIVAKQRRAPDDG